MLQSLLTALLCVALAAGGAAQSSTCRAGETRWERPGTFMGATTDGIGILFTDENILAFRLNNGSAIWQEKSSYSRSRAICFLKNDRKILVSNLVPRERKILYGLMDPATGKYIWKRLLPMRRNNDESFDCDALQSLDYLELRRRWRSTYVSKTDGAVLWDDGNIRGQYNHPQLIRNDVLVYVLYDGAFSLEGRQPTTGNLLWRRKLKTNRFYTAVYRGIPYQDLGRTITIFNETTGLPVWTTEGGSIDYDPSAEGPFLIRTPSEDKACSFDKFTGKRMWCIKFRGSRFVPTTIPGSQDISMLVGETRHRKLLRIDHRTGKVLYKARKEFRRYDYSAAYFFDVVRPKRTETYFTGAGRIERIAPDGTKLWVTSVPAISFFVDTIPVVIQDILHLGSNGNQRVFLFSHPRGSGLIALHYNTGEVKWLIFEQWTLIGFDDDVTRNTAPIYLGEKFAVFSTQPNFRFSRPRPGAGRGTVRAIRTRC